MKARRSGCKPPNNRERPVPYVIGAKDILKDDDERDERFEL
jgi:hypothetical protein